MNHDRYFENRIGLVMYGGVSLAIYMNGIAKEFLNLVLSTARKRNGEPILDLPSAGTADSLSGTQVVYRLMADFIGENERGLHPKFVVDIISGTSAGGLNGMFLAKSLAQRVSFDPLRDLWINEGEIGLLLDREESYKDLPNLSRRPSRSLLNSRRMYLKLVKALEAMDGRPMHGFGEHQLVAELDLHMTATDLVGRPIPVNLGMEDFVPKTASDARKAEAEANGQGRKNPRRFQLEKEHRAAFHFRYAPGEIDPWTGKPRNDFEPRVNPFIAFVGRCTSSIVPAFEPMRFKDGLDTLSELGQRRNAADWKQFYGPYWRSADFLPDLGGKSITTKEALEEFPSRPFGDGGYLDNRPFGHAFTSLKKRRADRPVRRMVFYVEPHPELNSNIAASLRVPDEPISAVRHAQLAKSLPGGQNINGRVAEMRKLADQSARLRRAAQAVSGSDDPPPVHLYFESTLDQLAALLGDLLGFGDDTTLIPGLRSLLHVALATTYTYANRRVAQGRRFHTWVHEHFDVSYHNRIFEFIRTSLEEESWKAADPRANGNQPNLNSLADAEKKIANLYGGYWGTNRRANWAGPDESFARMRHLLDELRLGKPLPSGSREAEVIQRLLDLKLSIDEVCYVQVRSHENKESDLPVDLQRAEEILVKSLRIGDRDLNDQVDDGFQADQILRRQRPHILLQLISGLGRLLSLPELKGDYDAWMKNLNDPRITMSKFQERDTVLFPLLYQAGMTDSYALDLVRVSPMDATSLTGNLIDPAGKLAGIGLGHFAAFLTRPGRYMDIVWGRLDAAEVILKTYLPATKAKELLLKAQLAIVGEALLEAEKIVGTSRDADEDASAAVVRLEALYEAIAGREQLDLKKDEADGILTKGQAERLSIVTVSSTVKTEIPKPPELSREKLWDLAPAVVETMGEVLDGVNKSKGKTTVSERWFARFAKILWVLVEATVPRRPFFRAIEYWFQILFTLTLILLVGTFFGIAPTMQVPLAKIMGLLVLAYTIRELISGAIARRADVIVSGVAMSSVVTGTLVVVYMWLGEGVPLFELNDPRAYSTWTLFILLLFPSYHQALCSRDGKMAAFWAGLSGIFLAKQWMETREISSVFKIKALLLVGLGILPVILWLIRRRPSKLGDALTRVSALGTANGDDQKFELGPFLKLWGLRLFYATYVLVIVLVCINLVEATRAARAEPKTESPLMKSFDNALQTVWGRPR